MADADPMAAARGGAMAAAQRATAAGDHEASLNHWRLYREMGDDLAGALGEAAALRALKRAADADAALATYAPSIDALSRATLPDELAVSYALNPMAAADWPGALDRWRAVRQGYPAVPVAWATEAALLQILGALDDADGLTEAALQRFPKVIDVMAQRLNVALARRDWAAGLLALSEIEATHPGHPYTLQALPAQRAQLEQALAALDAETLAGVAAALGQRGAWPAAVPAYRRLLAMAPDDAGRALRLAAALRAAAAYDEAETLLDELVRRFPGWNEPWAERAQLAAARGDGAEAVRRWRALLRDFPPNAFISGMAAVALRQNGELAEATALLAAAVAAAPDDAWLQVERARTAEQAEDYAEAVEAWDQVVRLRPDDLNLRNARGDAIWQHSVRHLEQRLQNGTATMAAPAAEPALGHDDAADLKRLAMGFEGLGDNCEFGIVQRRFGADPIGLFRFAAIGIAPLARLVEEDFASIGDPAHTELGLTPDGEYLVRDTRGIYHMHSFVRQGAVDEAKFLKEQVRRLGFLKRKLLEDLADAGKIMVYKATFGAGEPERAALHAALRRHGPNRLLVVTKADADHPAGTVVAAADGLYAGYVGTVYDAADSVIDLAAWRTVLERVAAHRGSA